MIGHVQTSETAGAPCRCGKRGCLESIVGMDGIARAARAAAESGASPFLVAIFERTAEVTVADVANGAQLGDAFCAGLAARCGRLVGESLAPLANLLNPSAIVLGKEPVYLDGPCVGYVTSAGFGYAVGESIAYAWLPQALNLPGTGVVIEYFGQDIPATVVSDPRWDPQGERVRA